MKVAVIGAGAVGSSIARELRGNGHDVVVIDAKPEAIGRLNVEGLRWTVGDACDLEVLENAGLSEAEVVVAATGDDRVNLVVSLMARSEFGVPRTVGRVNNPKNEWLFDDSWGVDVAVSTPRLMTALVEEAVEVGDVVRVLSLQHAAASINAYTVPPDHAVIGSRVGSIAWPGEAAPVAILRDGLPIVPSRDDVIEGQDELFFLVTGAGEQELRDLFRAGDSPEHQSARAARTESTAEGDPHDDGAHERFASGGSPQEDGTPREEGAPTGDAAPRGDDAPEEAESSSLEDPFEDEVPGEPAGPAQP